MFGNTMALFRHYQELGWVGGHQHLMERGGSQAPTKYTTESTMKPSLRNRRQGSIACHGILCKLEVHPDGGCLGRRRQ